MRLAHVLSIGSAVFLVSAPALVAGDWVEFVNQTSLRMPIGPGLNNPAVSTADPEEKKYVWGDVDHDGDIDLVCARKQPFTSIGGRRNVLFMNEGTAQGHAINGVLIDRTAQYIPGFLDLTNDKDIVLTDVNDDGWADLVTSPMYGQGLPPTISHPRVYMNQGEIDGLWQGYVYESNRIPVFATWPNFTGVAAGDVTGDQAVDLYFVDNDSLQPNTFDDRLLINDGNGFFTDESELRMTPQMLSSAYGIQPAIADMNGDGWKDIVKCDVDIVETFNNARSGIFDILETTYSPAQYGDGAYFVSVGELNNDGRLDLVVGTDALDRYLLNIGNGGNGMADFTTSTFPPSTNGLSGDSVIADLNKDGWNDVLIADIDVDLIYCTGAADILRNNANPPNVTFGADNGGIPNNMLNGVHDFASFDVNGDAWLDLVIGRCNSTEVWISHALAFVYPAGLPGTIVPLQQTAAFTVELDAAGDALDPDSPMLHLSINDGPFMGMPLELSGENLYNGSIPAGSCLDRFEFYLTGQLVNGLYFSDPPDAPATVYHSIVAGSAEVLVDQHFEVDALGWTVINDPSLTFGEWERVSPIGTTNVSGSQAAPIQDATPGDGNVMAFVTENGAPGGAAFLSDVDWGPTYLISPPFDLEGASEAIISYARWMFSTLGVVDQMTVEVSNDGSNWVLVESVGGTDGLWEAASIILGDFVALSSSVQVRFGVCDCTFDSITEAGIDDFKLEILHCTLSPDLNGDGTVDAQDLALLLGSWGACGDCPADLNGDGVVNAADLALLLGAWG